MEYLRAAERGATKEIAAAVLKEKIVQRRGCYMYDWDARSTLLRALHSLEKRGLVIRKGLVRGEDTKWTAWSDDKWKDGYVIFGRPIHRSSPTREMVWEIAPPGYTPEMAAEQVKADKLNAWFKRLKKEALASGNKCRLGPGEDDIVIEDEEILIDLCNYTDHERLLNIDERTRGHCFVVGIECNKNDVGYFRSSGATATEAMQAALEELGSRLQLTHDTCF